MATEQQAAAGAAAMQHLVGQVAKLETQIAALDDGREKRRVRLEDLALRVRTLTSHTRKDPHLQARLRPLRAALEAAVRREAAKTQAVSRRGPAASTADRSRHPGADNVTVRLAMALHDPFSCDITVSCHTDAGRLRADVERVIGWRPFCVAWLP